MEIREDTTQFFIQDKNKVLCYLTKRGMKNDTLFDVIRRFPFALLSDAEFIIGSEEYEVSHLLSASEISGYDIEAVNNNLNLEDSSIVAFAMIVGDDLLCYDTQCDELFLWLIQSGDGEKVVIEDTLTEFLKGIFQIS